MKRCLLVCSLVLVFALLLSACAADEANWDVAAEAAPEAVWDEPVDAEPASDDWADDVVAEADFDDWVADEAVEESEPVATPEPAPVAESAPEASEESEAPALQRTFDDDPLPLPIITPGDENDRRLTYVVNMDLQSDEFTRAINFLVRTVDEMGGFLENNHIQGRDMRNPEQERTATYSFRIPTENLAEFVAIIYYNYNVLESNLVGEDVTLVYERDDWEFEDLDEFEQRLTEELNNEELTAPAIQDIEADLARIQADLRDLEQRRSEMDYNMIYTPVYIRLFEVIIITEEPEPEVVEPTFGERFTDAASNSMGGFMGFLGGLAIVIVTILPTLVMLAILVFAIIFFVRKHKKWREANPKKEAAPSNSATYQNPNHVPYWIANNQSNAHNNQNNVHLGQNVPNPAQPPNATENQSDREV